MELSTWAKRETVRLVCPSGTVCYVRRMGPELALRGGRIQRILNRAEQTKGTNQSEQELAFLESLNDDELVRVMSFAREVVLATVVTPQIVQNPVNEDQIGPEDVPLADFWFLYKWAMQGARDVPVKMEEGETTVDTVETFPGGSATEIVSGADGDAVQ